MKILAVSDEVDNRIYTETARDRLGTVDLILGCGDLPYFYLDYIVSILNVPCYYVRGNHDKPYSADDNYLRKDGTEPRPGGCLDINQKIIRNKNLIIAGLQGCRRYNLSPDFQYSEHEMWMMARSLVPGLLWNEWRHKRAMDILVTHAPPFGIHDDTDLAHIGFHAYNWLIKRFQPRLFVHGHKHVYRSDEQIQTQVGKTRVVNVFKHQVLTLD